MPFFEILHVNHNQSEASFLAGNSLTSYFHPKSKPTTYAFSTYTLSTEYKQIHIPEMCQIQAC